MTWMDNFVQATVIMCLGMGLVFLFVSTLIVLIRCSARILANYPDEDAAAASPAAAAPPAANDGAVIAAIAMALHRRSPKQ